MRWKTCWWPLWNTSSDVSYWLIFPSFFIKNVRSFRKNLTVLISCGSMFIARSLNIRSSCQTLRYAFSMSRKAAAVLCLTLRFPVILSRTLISYVVVECRGLKQIVRDESLVGCRFWDDLIRVYHVFYP